MKRYFPVLCVSLFALTANLFSDTSGPAEQPGTRLLRLHYENSLGEKGVTVFNYNQKGSMYKALWYLVNGKRNSLNSYGYDTEGKLIKKYREFSDQKTSVQAFKYNSLGQLIFEDFKRSDGVSGFVRHFYDEKGNRIRSECHGLNGWFHGNIEYKYNSDGTRRNARIRQGEKKVGEIIFNYDRQRLVKEFWDFTGKWNQTFTYEYEKEADDSGLPFTSSNPFVNIDSGYRVARENYDYSGKSGGPSDYEYIGRKLEKKIFTRSDGLKTETFYFYDSGNKLINSLRKYADGRSAVFSYKYNKSRKLINRKGLGPGGFRSDEIYTYNDQGQLIRADWDNFDQWLTGVLMFRLDGRGRLSTGKFTGAGKKKFNADIRFGFNEDGNLVRVHWKFSFPGTQTYTFRYNKN